MSSQTERLEGLSLAKTDPARSYWLPALGLMLLIAAGVLGFDRCTLLWTRASIGGLDLEVVSTRWLIDQMDHGGEGFSMPDSMMPGLPEQDAHRLAVELQLENRAEITQSFDPSQLRLLSSAGGEYQPLQREPARVPSGHAFSTYNYYDVPGDDYGDLRLEWARGTTLRPLVAVAHPPDHFEAPTTESAESKLPAAHAELPTGNASRGKDLYQRELGCISCHGTLDGALPATIGPRLRDLPEQAGHRQPEKSAEQYVYESLLDPGGFIAPNCNGRPCVTPSLMPPIAGRLTPRDAADVVAYLLEP